MRVKKILPVASVFLNLLLLILLVFLVNDRSSDYSQLIIRQNPEPSQPKVIGEKTNKEGEIVTEVIDGDTIVLGSGEVARYIGIDTPENSRSEDKECFADKAFEINRNLVEGKLVRLEKDISERDGYGRLLRYVWVGDLFVNDFLVREGYAHSVSYPPDVAYQNQFQEAEREALESNKGLWGECSSLSKESI